jgi:hypothetical protein
MEMSVAGWNDQTLADAIKARPIRMDCIRFMADLSFRFWVRVGSVSESARFDSIGYRKNAKAVPESTS